MIKPELLVPAGNREKLEVAVAYGADAVYFGGRDFSLRARAGNFSRSGLIEAIRYCREHRVKSYLTINSLAKEDDFPSLAEFLYTLKNFPPDALIVADPGVIDLCRRILPAVSLHLSTQVNTMNSRAAIFWRRQGITRINLARELSRDEIYAIVRNCPELEFEVFVHGAMCMAYSGRCLLSAALVGRSANRGDCAQPCRWGYQLLPAKRSGEYLSLVEDQRGSYIFNSRDLCLLHRLPELAAAGIAACKIEGRMKSAYYVAVTTRVYRQALDRLAASGGFDETELKAWKKELTRISHRGYTESFFSNYQGAENTAGRCSANDFAWINNESVGYRRGWLFLALVEKLEEYDSQQGESVVLLKVKERLKVGMRADVLSPEMKNFPTVIQVLEKVESMEPLKVAHPGTRVRARCQGILRPFQILRCPIKMSAASQN